MPEDKSKNEENTGKNAAKKAAKKEAKAAKRAEHKAAVSSEQTETSGEDVSKGKYGNLPLIRSESHIKRNFINVIELSKNHSGEIVWLRARLHAVRGRGKQCFAVLRQREATVQGIVCVDENVSKQMVKFASKYVFVTHRKS